MKNWCVYIHTTPDGKVYVGTTGVKPSKRWNYGYGYRGTPFFDAILTFGWNNISHDIIKEGLTKEEAYSLEIQIIRDYDATNPRRGYNRATGGHGSSGVRISEETRSRLSESHFGKKNPHSEEWNRKISDSLRGKSKPHCGVPRSEECKRKIAEKHSKPVLQFLITGELVNRYSSAREAERQTGIANQNIANCCLGKSFTAGGFIWKYLNV